MPASSSCIDYLLSWWKWISISIPNEIFKSPNDRMLLSTFLFKLSQLSTLLLLLLVLCFLLFLLCFSSVYIKSFVIFFFGKKLRMRKNGEKWERRSVHRAKAAVCEFITPAVLREAPWCHRPLKKNHHREPYMKIGKKELLSYHSEQQRGEKTTTMKKNRQEL
jgi:cytochrome c oxidase assembly protein Cox11